MNRLRTLAALFLVAFVLVDRSESQEKDARSKIAALEKKLAQNGGKFSYETHNELRHLYSGIDPAKSLYHLNLILKQKAMDGYMLDILADHLIDKDRVKAVAKLQSWTDNEKEYPFVAAACWLKIGDLLKPSEWIKAKECYRKVLALKGRNLRNTDARGSRSGGL